jgi:hypothetical protein
MQSRALLQMFWLWKSAGTHDVRLGIWMHTGLGLLGKQLKLPLKNTTPIDEFRAPRWRTLSKP